MRARVTLPNACDLSLTLPVCRPAIESGSLAIRTATLHFMQTEGVTFNADTVLDWANQDWAQCCVRFDRTDVDTNVHPVSNAIQLLGAAGSDGELLLTVNGHLAIVPVQHGDSNEEIGAAAAASLSLLPGVVAEWFRHEADSVLVLVNRGTSIEPAISPLPLSTVQGLIVDLPVLTYADDLVSTLEAAVLGLNYADDDPTTIDFLICPTVSLAIDGQSALAGRDGGVPGMINTIVSGTPLLPPAALENTHLPGHELGHPLINLSLTHDDHSPIITNLMYRDYTQPEPDVQTTKRLDTAQYNAVRAQSGPQSEGPVLLQPR